MTIIKTTRNTLSTSRSTADRINNIKDLLAEIEGGLEPNRAHEDASIAYRSAEHDFRMKSLKAGTYYHPNNTSPTSWRINQKASDKSGMGEVCSPDIRPLLSPKVKAIKECIAERSIANLIHFTRYENIEGIVKNGLVVRSKLDSLRENVFKNDNLRLEGYEESLSLSISFPNYKMFYKYRMSTSCRGWVVIAVDPSILWEYKCAFCKNNAADSRISGRQRSKLMGVDSLKGMFIEDSNDKGVRHDERLQQFDTTDSQAEILVFQNIPMLKILEFNFADPRLLADFQSKYSNLNAKLKTTYFSSRSYVR